MYISISLKNYFVLKFRIQSMIDTIDVLKIVFVLYGL